MALFGKDLSSSVSDFSIAVTEYLGDLVYKEESCLFVFLTQGFTGFSSGHLSLLILGLCEYPGRKGLGESAHFRGAGKERRGERREKRAFPLHRGGATWTPVSWLAL